MTFREYFLKVYLPTKRWSARRIESATNTVDQFVQMIGEDRTPEDITAGMLERFLKVLRADGWNYEQCRRKRERIDAIYREALPDRESLFSKLEKTPVEIPEAPSDTLTGYLGAFLRITGNCDRHAEKSYLAAMQAFAAWYGGEPLLKSITTELIDEFEESATNPYQRRLAGSIRTVMRTWDPVNFKFRRPRNPENDQQPDYGDSLIYLRQLYLKQYEPKALRSRRPNTKRLYLNTLNQFDKFLGREATLDDLNDDAVGEFVGWVLDTGRSKSTANKHIFNLCAIWRWCNKKGILDTWPDVQLEKPPKRSPQAWTQEEMIRLFNAACKFPGNYGDIPSGDWWRALILVLWDSCERINPVLELRWQDVNLETGWVRFDAENRKGAAEDNDCELSQETVAALASINRDREIVFAWPYDRCTIWLHLTKILETADLPTDCRCKFHRIRRTAASFAAAGGANATELLRHTKIEITKAYIDRRIVKRQQAKDYLFRLVECKSYLEPRNVGTPPGNELLCN